jgi:spore maturation protein CgeB
LITNQSKIALVFSKGLEGELQVKGRVFETPAYGSCTFIEYFPGIEKYFKVDEEIVVFKNKKELVEKARFYLKHSERREKIAELGRKRALKDHTYEKRFKKIFKKISDKKTAFFSFKK